MSAEPATATATTAGEGEGALSYALHPLVILTVSDHFTRARLASDDAAFNAHFSAATTQQQQQPAEAAATAQSKRRWKKPRVLGALLGTQRGREVEICNCFELLLSASAEEGGEAAAEEEGEEEQLKGSVDVAFLRMKAEQFKKVFPDYDVLGWYTDGREPRASDIVLHRQLAASGAATESPLLLMLDTAAAYAADTKDLPIRVFESEIHVAPDGQPLLTLSPVVYRIATVEAERIGVDHVAHSSAGTGASQLSVHLMGMHGSIKMLHARIKILRAFVDMTLRGELPFDHEAMRQIARVCSLLPAADTDDFRRQFLAEYTDALLVTYLTTITKAVNAMSDLTDHFSTAYGSGGSAATARYMAMARHSFFA